MLFGVFFLIAYLKLYFTSWLKIKQIDGMIFNEEYFFNLTLRLFFYSIKFCFTIFLKYKELKVLLLTKYVNVLVVDTNSWPPL